MNSVQGEANVYVVCLCVCMCVRAQVDRIRKALSPYLPVIQHLAEQCSEGGGGGVGGATRLLWF